MRMADAEQLRLLEQGVAAWNAWRETHPEVRRPNLAHTNLAAVNLHGANLRRANLKDAKLRGADLRRADLFQANLRGADLREAKLREAKVRQAHLEGADLREAILLRTNLSEAHLEGADLRGANIRQANLSEAHLQGAKLEGAILHAATLVETNLEQANLTGSHVYGIAAWNPKLDGAIQSDLVITRENEATITVDDLEIAQFIYIMLDNQKIRNAIDTLTSKAVLILGRFTDERKAVLDALRNELRKHNYLPILFDFDKPVSKDVTGTIETLARMARFIVADLTDPSSIPHELATIVPFLRTTPILPLRRAGSGGYSMFDDYQRAYALWVLTTYEYTNEQALIAALPDVIAPAEKRAHELRTSP